MRSKANWLLNIAPSGNVTWNILALYAEGFSSILLWTRKTDEFEYIPNIGMVEALVHTDELC